MTVFTSTDLTVEKPQKDTFVHDGDDNPQVPSHNFSDEIPVISLAGIDDEATGRRTEIKKKIVEACEVWGTFQVVDHGVDTKLMSDMIRLATEFFDLPLEEKLRFNLFGGEKGGFMVTKKEVVRDWREIVTFFTYPTSNRNYTVWPDKPEGWIATTEEYSEKLMGLTRKLLELLSEAMALEKEALTKACLEMNQKILANFYPKCLDSNLALGLQRHTDPGTITLLLQDHAGGLQTTRDGGKSWIIVRPLKGAFVVNIGDHVHFLSNGWFKNGDHQVVPNSDANRLSIATFQTPTLEAIVYPLKLREEEKAVLDEPITYAEMYTRKMSKQPLLALFNKVIDGHKIST